MSDSISNESIDLSICIVNYNTTGSVLKLIESINDNIKNITYEILVVDNDSDDNATRITDKYKYVKMIRSSTNLYFTKADNINIQRSKGKYILSINPDTLVRPNALQNMIDFLKNHKDVGAVAPRIIYPDGQLQVSTTPFLTMKFSLFEASGFNKRYPNNKTKRAIDPADIYYDPEIVHEAEVLYGACIMIRREVLETVGPKDEKFVHGWDEYDWSKRIHDYGWKLCYVPNAVIVHYRSESIHKMKVENDTQKLKVVDKYGRNGYYYLHRKHFGYLAYILLRLTWALNISISKLLSAHK